MSQTILERTGNSKWYMKGTNEGERPEIAAMLVKLSMGTEDDDAD